VPKSEWGTSELQALVKDMIETMRHAKGVGLAAPQIGIPKRIIIVAPPDEEPVAVVNPVIGSRSLRKAPSEEGCLSVPGTWGIVRRNTGLKVKGVTPDGAPFKKTVSGFEAIIFQHEVDHLNGILFIDKAEEVQKLGVRR
jgi:peptide deformylase